MKFSIFLMALAVSVGSSVSAMAEILDDLDSLRWEYRVILVYANEPLATSATANLEEFDPEIKDRNIAWFVLNETGIRTNFSGELGRGLRDRLMETYFNPVPAESAVLLIGKDGYVKNRTADLDLDRTFETIDAMPMRRQEMRRSGKG